MADAHTVALSTVRGTTELHTEPSVLGITAAGFVALSMLVVVGIILWARVPRMIAGVLDGRIATIRRELDEASRLRAEAEALLEAARERTAAQAEEASAIVDHARAEAAALIDRARVDADELVSRRTAMAEDRIGAAERTALTEVRARAAEAATRAAGAIIAQRHGADADRALVDRDIAALGRPH